MATATVTLKVQGQPDQKWTLAPATPADEQAMQAAFADFVAGGIKGPGARTTTHKGHRKVTLRGEFSDGDYLESHLANTSDALLANLEVGLKAALAQFGVKP